MVVLMVNTAIELIIRVAARFEKHHSEDTKGESVFIRLVVLNYINTGKLLQFFFHNFTKLIRCYLFNFK